MEAVKQDGRALQYASAELKGDREIVMEAVAQDPKALQYASDGTDERWLRRSCERYDEQPIQCAP